MGMPKFVLLAILLGWGVPPLVLAQSDFERYVEEVRKSGMTEDAAGSIRMAAMILSGATIFEVKPAPDGSLRRSYSSPMCFRPGADSEQLRALRERIEAKQQVWIAFLKTRADTDGSGFVSTEEGSAMRRRVELGQLLVQLPDVGSLDDLLKALRAERRQVIEDLAAYARLQAQAAKEGLDSMPPLPKYLIGAM
jgi:hypothetical protein